MSLYFRQNGFDLYNGDCLGEMAGIADVSVDIVITSPPYNTCRKGTLNEADSLKGRYHQRYDIFIEEKTKDEYCEWTADVFREFDRLLKKDRVVLYNLGLGNDSQTEYASDDWFGTVSYVCENTPFTVADLLFWKKKCALPNNMSRNKSTRIVEPVIVFCRKDEMMTFLSNKKVTGCFEKTGQKLYSPFYNIFEARNNDGSNNLNKATYSTQFVDILIGLYCPDEMKKGWTILDPFNGTGTTGMSALANGMNYIGIELSEPQCQYTVDRLRSGTELYLF